MWRWLLVLAGVSLFRVSLCQSAEIPKPIKTDANEALAGTFDALKAAEYLDAASLYWTKERKCAACHTNVPYMLARPLLVQGNPETLREIRQFMEQTVDAWEKRKPRADYEVFATAFGLAAHDAQTTKKLHPKTKIALDRAWSLQKKDGSFQWPKCDWPPLEHDDYMGVLFLGLATYLAPEEYAKTVPAQRGLTLLQQYLAKNTAPDLHHRAMLLWLHSLSGTFMTDQEKRDTIAALKTKQRADGGWSLPSLGTYTRHDGTPNFQDAPSDGYATGFVLYVLRQSGEPADSKIATMAVQWLQQHQRQSGRWFTRSLSTDGPHLIANAGSAFAVLALASCNALPRK